MILAIRLLFAILVIGVTICAVITVMRKPKVRP